MLYYVFYLTETDGEVGMMALTTKEQVDEFVKKEKLYVDDYYVIHGTRIK